MSADAATGNYPYRVSNQYARGEITREQVVDALTTWRYLPAETKTKGLHDELLNYVEGSFDDVVAAFDDELIDLEIYNLAQSAMGRQIREDRADNV